MDTCEYMTAPKCITVISVHKILFCFILVELYYCVSMHTHSHLGLTCRLTTNMFLKVLETQTTQKKLTQALREHVKRSIDLDDHILVFKKGHRGQDGGTGQIDSCKMNGDCRKQKPNPEHFCWLRNSGPTHFLGPKQRMCPRKRTFGHPTIDSSPRSGSNGRPCSCESQCNCLVWHLIKLIWIM